jgi:hypothetical protein
LVSDVWTVYTFPPMVRVFVSVAVPVDVNVVVAGTKE